MKIFTCLWKIPHIKKSKFTYKRLTGVGTPAILNVGDNSVSIFPVRPSACKTYFDGIGVHHLILRETAYGVWDF
jgi:hypothetical protein